MDKDDLSYQCLTDEQLLDKTARLLRILELSLERKQTLLSQKVQNLITEREKLKTINTIIDQLQGLVSSGNAKGFVFGLVTKNKTWSISSDNLFRWWNKNVKFEQNGPRALASEISESFELDALKDLNDTTLSSIISVLMPHCRPAQRSSPFRGETPVAWWPKGTEEWWGRINILKDSGPPEYKKPHNLRKPAKIAVLVAIIKNFQPNFSKIRTLVSDSQTLQNKMNQKENDIWLAVIRGEEIRMRLHPDYQRCSNANMLKNSRIESNSCYIADKNVKVEKIDCRGTGDKLVDNINSPSTEKGENSSENKKKMIAGKEQVINTGSSASTIFQGPVSILTKVDEPGVVNDRKNSNEEFIAYPEKVPVSENNFPTCSQMKDRTKKCENIKKRKLKGIVNPNPKRLKLPHRTYACRWSSHDMRGPLSESTGSFDEIIRSKKLNEIVIGLEAIKLPNKPNKNAGQSSCGDYAANKYNLSKNKTGRLYDSLSSFSAPTRGQVHAFNSNSLIPHDQSLNQYTSEKGSVSMDNEIQSSFQTINGSQKLTSFSINGDHLSVESSFQPNKPVTESYKVENYETDKMGRSAFTEPGAVGKIPKSTLTQGSMENKNHDFQFQINSSTFYPSSTSANNIDLGNTTTYQTPASYSMPTRDHNTTFNLADTVKSLTYSNAVNQRLTNLNSQIQHQLLLDSTTPGSVATDNQIQNNSQIKYGSLNLTSLSITGDHLSIENCFQHNTSSVPESYKVENYETNKMERSAFSEPNAVGKSPDSTIMLGFMDNKNRDFQFQTNNSTFYSCSTSENNFDLGKNIVYQPTASYSMPTSGQKTTVNLTDIVKPFNHSNTADQSSTNLNLQIQHSLPLDSTKPGYVSLDNQTKSGSPNLTFLSIPGDHLTVESSFQSNRSVAESYKVENYETSTMGRSAFTERGADGKSPISISMQGSINNEDRDFQLQTNNSTFYPSFTSANNFDLGNNITYQTTVFYSMPTSGQNTTFNLTDTVKSLNNSNKANKSLTDLNRQIQHQLPLDSTEPDSVNINPQSQDQLNLVSKKQGLRDSKPQVWNQFDSGSSCNHPILESSHSQITNSEWLSNSSVSKELGANDSGKNKDLEKTMDTENAMDSDAAAESGQQNFESDDLAVQLKAFHALDSFNSNNLDCFF